MLVAVQADVNAISPKFILLFLAFFFTWSCVVVVNLFSLGIAGRSLQVILALATDAAQVDIGAFRRGLSQTGCRAGAPGDIALHTARADVDVAGVRGLPVRGDGGLVGKRQFGAHLLDLLGLLVH